jgi:hypothetical protein
MCDSSYAVRALPSVCIELNSHSVQYASLRAVWGATHAAGCTGSQGITGQDGRQEPGKENRKPTTGNCCVPWQVWQQLDHPPQLCLLFRIRHKETSIQLSNIGTAFKHRHSIQTSIEPYSKFYSKIFHLRRLQSFHADIRPNDKKYTYGNEVTFSRRKRCAHVVLGR